MEAAGKDTEDVDHHQEGAGGDDKGNEKRIEVDDSEKKKGEVIDALSTGQWKNLGLLRHQIVSANNDRIHIKTSTSYQYLIFTLP